MKNEIYILVAGSRIINDPKFIFNDLDYLLNKCGIYQNYMDITIVTGNADGVDTIANDYAFQRDLNLIMMPANWGRYGKQAGFVRNEKMHQLIASHMDRLCICYKDINSPGKGTTHSIELSSKYHTNLIFNYIEQENGIYKLKNRETIYHKNTGAKFNYAIEAPDENLESILKLLKQE